MKLKIRNTEDLIQEAQHLIQSCSEREPRENGGVKVTFQTQANVPGLKDESRDPFKTPLSTPNSEPKNDLHQGLLL